MESEIALQEHEQQVHADRHTQSDTDIHRASSCGEFPSHQNGNGSTSSFDEMGCVAVDGTDGKETPLCDLWSEFEAYVVRKDLGFGIPGLRCGQASTLTSTSPHDHHLGHRLAKKRKTSVSPSFSSSSPSHHSSPPSSGSIPSRVHELPPPIDVGPFPMPSEEDLMKKREEASESVWTHLRGENTQRSLQEVRVSMKIWANQEKSSMLAQRSHLMRRYVHRLALISPHVLKRLWEDGLVFFPGFQEPG
jgi:hypothetical protein